MVLPQDDGTADEWFTNVQYRGPSFVTKDYTMPNHQPSTQLFYHDHVLGVTRLGVYARRGRRRVHDPRSQHRPRRAELPLAERSVRGGPRHHAARLLYGRPPSLPARYRRRRAQLPTAGDDAPDQIAYWTYDTDADVNLVNGKAYPNLNVQPRQYRFRTLMGGNNELYDLQLQNQTSGSVVPFIIIGSDGGYLPAPQTVTDVQLGITERVDILVDFSQFAAGTKIVMVDLNSGDASSTKFNVMQFTVQSGTPVHPAALNPSLFPPRAVLTADAPMRTKVLRTFSDLRNPDGDAVAATRSTAMSARSMERSSPRQPPSSRSSDRPRSGSS